MEVKDLERAIRQLMAEWHDRSYLAPEIVDVSFNFVDGKLRFRLEAKANNDSVGVDI